MPSVCPAGWVIPPDRLKRVLSPQAPSMMCGIFPGSGLSSSQASFDSRLPSRASPDARAFGSCGYLKIQAATRWCRVSRRGVGEKECGVIGRFFEGL